jgi:hypothetical protein
MFQMAKIKNAMRVSRMRTGNLSSKPSSSPATEHPDAPDYSKLSRVPDYSILAAGDRINI